MGETVIVITNGAEHANTSSDSSTLSSSPDDQPPIAEPPDISAIEKPQCPHTLPARRVAELLKTDTEDGLSDQEAAARLARDGPNTIKGAKGISIWEIFLQQVANALTVVLIAVMALSFAIHDFVEGGVVLAVILLNIIVGYVSKTDAERKRPSLLL
jgi:magnesium-transporting ATPase (P-type)